MREDGRTLSGYLKEKEIVAWHGLGIALQKQTDHERVQNVAWQFLTDPPNVFRRALEVKQEPPHTESVGMHILSTLRRVDSSQLLPHQGRLVAAALSLHDISKAYDPHDPLHAIPSARMARLPLALMGYSGHEIEHITKLIRYHHLGGDSVVKSYVVTPREMAYRCTKGELEELRAITIADITSIPNFQEALRALPQIVSNFDLAIELRSVMDRGNRS